MKSALQPTGLMCDLLTNTARATVHNATPTFSWIVNDQQPNAHQEAYQILVASSAALLLQNEGDLWDTGLPNPGTVWKSNNQSIHIPYEGAPLTPNTTYYWKVRTWNGVGNDSPWSLPCTFQTGDLTQGHSTDCQPLAITEVEPQVVVQTAADRWFIDFGRAAFATLDLTLDLAEERTVEIILGEVPQGRYGINPEPGGARRYQVIPLEVSAGKKTYRIEIPRDPRNTKDFAILMPDELFEVYPFRYCEIVGYTGPLTHDSLRQITVHYPFDDNAASFTSSSKVLNDVWQMCKYTMKATSFCGYYVDGDRERIPYEADVYINQLGHYCCDREYAMARLTHEYLITTPTWPTEWILYSVLVAWNDYLYTGNVASLAHYYTDLKAKTLTEIARADGLITLELMTDDVLQAIHYAGRPAEHFGRSIEDNPDWPQAERDGFDMRPVNTEVNAFHYRAVMLMAAIAEALGKDEDLRWYRARAELIHKSFGEKLVDPITGLVLDGEGSTHSSLHANMVALAFGLVAAENRAAVIDHLKAKGMACSVYGSQLLMESLYAAHEADFALSLLTSTAERSWAHMVYEVGTTIALEAWDDRFKPNQDWNHAWGAAPANIIPRNLMGVQPLTPGFEQILIQPQPSSLEWAELTTPTIRGPVTVRFNQWGSSQGSARSIHLETETPANTVSTVMVPTLGSDDPTVVVDGKRVVGRLDRGFVTIPGVGSGLHVFDRAV